MTWQDVRDAEQKLRAHYSTEDYEKLRSRIIFNLERIEVDGEFFHAQFFKGEEFKAYVIIAHEYILHHPEYEFNETYTRTRKKRIVVLPPKKVIEETED